MKERNRGKSASVHKTRPFRVCRSRLLPLLLLGMLVMGGGCAKQSPAPLAPEPPVVVTQDRSDVIEAARSNLGVRYKFGGTSPETGFDCSGFVRWSYEQVGVKVPRVARDQYIFGERVDKKDLRPGDIVVFKGTRSRTGWHSGIYTGDGMFIHSPNKGKAVTESTLETGYFAKHYAGACRIPTDAGHDELYAAFEERKREAGAKKAPKGGKKAAPKSTLVAEAKKSGPSEKSAKPGKAAKPAGEKPGPAGASKNKNSAKTVASATQSPAKPQKDSSPDAKNDAVSSEKKDARTVKPTAKEGSGKTPLRSAVASTGTGGKARAEAVVNKLKTEKKAAPARSVRTRASGEAAPAPKSAGSDDKS